jgi:hypothetical protein
MRKTLKCHAYTNKKELYLELNGDPKWWSSKVMSIEIDISKCKMNTTYDTGSRHVTPPTIVALKNPIEVDGAEFTEATILFGSTSFTEVNDVDQIIEISEYKNSDDIEKFPLEPLGFGI